MIQRLWINLSKLIEPQTNADKYSETDKGTL